MKKKILIGVFLLLIFLTAIVFLAVAVNSYHYDMDLANGIDILEGLEAAMFIVLGGFVILCELDIFFTVYYFFMKPKTLAKTIFMILSQLMLLLVVFSARLAKLLSQYVSDIFGEDSFIILSIFFFYVAFRLICVSTCFSEKE